MLIVLMQRAGRGALEKWHTKNTDAEYTSMNQHLKTIFRKISSNKEKYLAPPFKNIMSPKIIFKKFDRHSKEFLVDMGGERDCQVFETKVKEEHHHQALRFSDSPW